MSGGQPERLTRLRARFLSAGLEGLVVSAPSNVFYLSGFRGSSGALLVSQDRAILASDFRYRLQAQEQAPEYQFVEVEKELYVNMGRLVATWGLKRTGYEAAHLTCQALEQLSEGAAGVELVPASPVEELRATKAERELQTVRQAVRLADDALALMVKMLRPGAKEREIALAGEFAMRRAGAEAASFNPIVASGPRSALPHAESTERELEPGDLVVIDIGARVDGYCSDLTRTFAVESASDQMREIYSLVYRAQRAAAAAAKAQTECADVDAVARAMIEAAGYADAFGHGLGHGVGVDVHEAPRVAKDEQTRLASGNVITIEPGIYVEGLGGVRLEDMVLVREDGVEVLTGSPMSEELPVI